MKSNWGRLACSLLMAGCPLYSQEVVLRGIVLDEKGQGVSEASVTLRDRSGLTGLRGSETDSQGQFQFDRLVPGHYAVAASKAGFVRDDRVTAALDSGYYPPGHSLDFAPDVWVRDGDPSPDPAVIHLVAQAVVGGTIVDQNGDPVVGSSVALYRYDREGDSFRLSQKSLGASSDDRGQYRVAMLTPGRYYVVAEQLGRERYVPVFYPGESDFAKAVPVDLASGESRLNVNIVLRAEQGRHIRGSVVDVLGKPVFGAHVWAIPEGGSFGEVAVSRLLYHAEAPVDENGRFDFGTFPTRGLPAGTYTLKALGAVAGSADGSEPNQRGLMGLSQMGVEAGRDLAYGSARVTVGGADVEGVSLRLRPPKTLNGYVRLENGDPVENVTVKFEAERFSDAVLLESVQARTGLDGIFTFPNAWATMFDVSVSGLPAGTYVKSIAYGEQDLLKGRLNHTEPPDERMEVVLSTSAGEIAGVVKDRNGSVAVGAQVFVWSKTPDSNVDIAGAWTDRDGRFNIGNLAPGDYYVVSTESAEIQLLRDQRFRGSVLQNAVAVTVGRSAHIEDLNLQAVPKELVRQLGSEVEEGPF